MNSVRIIDDSTYDRSRSKVVELLAWVHDHNRNRSLKGLKLLTLGWSDGVSFLPLDFTLCSSAKANKRIQGIKKELDKRCCGYKRRMEAMDKSTNHLEPMVKRVLARGIRADYLLMDSWFAFPSILAALGLFVTHGWQPSCRLLLARGGLLPGRRFRGGSNSFSRVSRRGRGGVHRNRHL